MKAASFIRTFTVATAALATVATPFVLTQSAQAAEIAGPAKCYIADEDFNILEPRREYTAVGDSIGQFGVVPSPVNPGNYTLETYAPAINFDPDDPSTHFVCDVFYSPLGSVRLVDTDGNVVASQMYGNDENDPSRASVTVVPAVPEGYEIVPGQSIYGYNPTANTVDPNNPTDGNAVGENTDIKIRRLANDPTPAPVPSTPATPTPVTPTPVTPTPATPVPSTPSTPAVVTPETPATPAVSTPPASATLAKTGAHTGMLAGATALLFALGAGAVALRKFRA